jgi:hypothetical protein
MLTGIGEAVGGQVVPPVGFYNSAGEDAGISRTASLGIDGVLDWNR